MKRMRVEVCLISARGLRRPSSLWKLQWYAVGWIDPNNKYCTKIDASGSKNPTWKTKFSALIDVDVGDNSKSPSLQVQVYSREPIFLREKLQGTATILLKEFFDKHHNTSTTTTTTNNSSSGLVEEEEEVGSFQLRKKSSGKPQGFVDVSIRVSEESDGGGGPAGGSFPNYYSGNNEEGFELGGAGRSNEIFIGEDGWSNVDDYHHHHPPRSHHHHHHHQPSDRSQSQQRPAAPPHWKQPESTHPVAHSMMPDNSNLQSLSVQDTPSSYRPPPPPPPPPSHVGYLPTFLPRTDHRFSGAYVHNVGAGGGTAQAGHGGADARNTSGFGMGMSVGALAAGAVLFGDDFMSGFDVPSGGLQEAPLTITTHPPF